MTMDQKQQVALFRYGVIAPLETGTSDPSISNNEFFRRAAQKTYNGPDGKETTVAAGTIENGTLLTPKAALTPSCRRAVRTKGSAASSRRISSQTSASCSQSTRASPPLRSTASSFQGEASVWGSFPPRRSNALSALSAKKNSLPRTRICAGMNAHISTRCGMGTPASGHI